MAITVKNQKPGVLTPDYTSPVKGDLDVIDIMKQILTRTIRQPLIQTQPVEIRNSHGTVDDNSIIRTAAECCGESFDSVKEQFMNELMSQTLLNYDKNTNLSFREIFPLQSAVTIGTSTLPEPNSTCIYTPTDVIPAATKFMAGQITYDEMFANFAYFCRFEAFCVYFMNEVEFQNFLQFFDQQIALIQNNLSPDCLNLINDFKKLKLDGLTESFKIRSHDADNNEEYSFARVIITILMNYCRQTSMTGLMPMNFSELVLPKNIIFFNIEQFAHSTPFAINQEIKDIQQAISMTQNINMVSNKKLAQLAAVPRALRKTSAAAAMAAANKNSMAARAARVQFKKKIPTQREYLGMLTKILNKMKTNRMTNNVYKYTKTSFQKPNRRDPDDFNKQGKITSTKYYPDIHLYIDTSGSISEEDYESSVKMAITLARKLNVNLYVNSFSHIMSQTVMLRCREKSIGEIYAKFQKIPKVTGGTNFSQIWDFINCSKKRQDELSIIISDMEWSAPGRFIKHPANLYYIPCANIKWEYIKSAASYFINSCEHNEPNIRRHVLM